MDTQTILNLLIAVVGALGGFMLRAIWAEQKELRDALAQVGEKYVRRDDFNVHADRVMDMLNRIFDKLDSKVDKQ